MKPVVYGSLAYAFYTRDAAVDINDLDVLIEEAAFPRIIAMVAQDSTIRHEATTYHSLKLFRAEAKISFDAKEEYYRDLPDEFVDGRVNGVDLRFVSREALKEVYRRGAATIPANRAKYLEKLKRL